MLTQERKTKSNNPAVRSLKIQPRTRDKQWSRTTVPEIKLTGSWLEKLGFTPDRRVNVTASDKMLVIRLDE